MLPTLIDAKQKRPLQLCGGLLLLFRWAAACLAFSCGAAYALPATLNITQLHHARWTADSGAPANAYALAQTGDGALWVGSQRGLFRFDGLRFHRFHADSTGLISHGDVSALLATPDDGLWIGLRYGGTYLWQDGKLRASGEAEGLPAGASVLAMGRLPDGRILAGLPQGLYVLEAGRWRMLGPKPEDAAVTPNGRQIWDLQVDRQGLLWIGSEKGVFTMSPGSARFERVADGNCGLEMSPDETIWCSSDTPIYLSALRLAPGAARARSGRLELKDATGALLADRDGGIWFSFLGGLARLTDPARTLGSGVLRRLPVATQTFAPAQGLSGTVVRALFEDRDGNVWVATNGGLDRFRAPRLTRVDHVELFDATMQPAPDGGLIACNAWLGTVILGRHLVRKPWFTDYCNAMHRTPDGALWIAANSGLKRLDGDLVHEVPLPPSDRPIFAVRSISSDRDGALWAVLLPQGVYRLLGGAWHAVKPPGLPPKTPLLVAGTPQGGVWLAYPGNRLAHVDGERVRMYEAKDGVHIGIAQATLARPEGLLLGGTGGLGLVRDGNFLPLRGAGGEGFNGTSGLVSEADGTLWINNGSGVLRVPPAELRRAVDDPTHPLAFERFDHRDGLLGDATQFVPLPSALRHPDGRLWFSTTRGLFTIDPRQIPRNARPPSVEILALLADGQPQPLRDGLRLAEGTSRLELDYTAFSLSIPERVRFRYRLDGVDSDWQEAGDRRHAFYTNVRPGNYRFQVLAANEDGIWHPQGAELRFAIEPSFHQTRWFAALSIGLGLLALWGLHRLRLRQVTRRMRARLEDRAEERERIARELHDTLLQSTQGLILSFGAIAQQAVSSEINRLRLEKALSRAEAVMAEGRRRVRNLRAPLDAGSELSQAILQVSEVLPEHGPQPQARITGQPRHLQPWAFEELCRLGQEAVINARRHAQASSIWVTVNYGHDLLTLTVKDDGCGIDPEVLAVGQRDGHWGLPGMDERARRLGGELFLLRLAEGGTEVRVTVAARRVYGQPAATGWRRHLSGLLISRPESRPQHRDRAP